MVLVIIVACTICCRTETFDIDANDTMENSAARIKEEMAPVSQMMMTLDETNPNTNEEKTDNHPSPTNKSVDVSV